ncbi:MULTISPECIES: DUF2752 domain-containing protein [unclassified Streptomyces]|uniref:DUF2752 domain-containing protein n=1 Tax=unclassified Streptomyces TaxID=2593676 RepID=UPI002E817200|nr:DUF2752 domain-containing protein [Streptomyces sp. NBC_00589]WTI39955.1 DUF2752 domain-containing protein [Streptomyces sp. NBC_00775]WUB26365.1 DUF2752 domain-containing protein [Streptomyces sp. NBC_00589]
MRRVNAETQRVTRAESPGTTVGAGAGAGADAGAGAGDVLRRLAVPGGILAAVVGAFAYVGAVDPHQPGHYPVCPLLRFTGVYCPGCGGLRGAYALVHGDFTAALTDNALAVAGYLVFAVVWTVWVIRSVRGRPMRIDLGPVHLWSVGALVLVFTVVRNLPSGGWLHP